MAIRLGVEYRHRTTFGPIPIREKGDALVIKTEQSWYSDVLKTMRRDAKLVDLGVDVHSIRRTRTGEMIVELKRDKERMGTAYSLAEEVLSEGVEVRALIAEATLKVKILDEITEAEEIVMALRQQCEVQCRRSRHGYR